MPAMACARPANCYPKKAAQRLANLVRPTFREKVQPVAGSRLIPKIIHQTYHSRQLPPDLASGVEKTRSLNKGWEYRFYDDDDIIRFLTDNFDVSVIDRFCAINPNYGAARADFFRYMLMYKVGGVYLDIKSFCDKPLDDCLKSDDEFILSNWRNAKGEVHEAYGLHKSLAGIDRGEYQQWHIICRPEHPFLRSVITKVSKSIDNYRPWIHGVGKPGVVRLTGPAAYTLAIEPIRHLHPHRLVESEVELGLRYNAWSNSPKSHSAHYRFFENHYTTRLDAVVALNGSSALMGRVHQAYAGIRQAAVQRFWRPWKERRRAKRRARL